MEKALLIILDGWGIGKKYEGNAIELAKTPNFDKIMETYPSTLLNASGSDVGLPDGQMGNSEVGHLNIGAGRIIYQDFTKITKSIEDKEFYNNKNINLAIDNAIKKGSNLHLIGLLSEGGVHSHLSHLIALLELCKKREFKNVYIHGFLDGRDVAPKSAIKDVNYLLKKINELGVGKIASISGRFFAMDRDNRWDRIEKAYNVMVGNKNKTDNIIEYLEDSYSNNITDEFIEPVSISYEDKNYNIKDNDSVICYNFRPDRAREITRSLTEKDFNKFENNLKNIFYVCMTNYDENFKNVSVAFPSDNFENTLGEVIAKNGLKQLRIAETEKYAHVTFFFNGGVENPNSNEDRILIPSPKVSTYDLKPEMSADEVKEILIKNIEKDNYDLIIANFANPDMVGHTGNLSASIKAIETVDSCLGDILKVIEKYNLVTAITSDHGNSEYLIDEYNKNIFTAHTTNKVPFIITNKEIYLDSGNLSDIAPTILEIMGIKKPKEMTGKSLIKNKF